jgi:hypothetical protein
MGPHLNAVIKAAAEAYQLTRGSNFLTRTMSSLWSYIPLANDTSTAKLNALNALAEKAYQCSEAEQLQAMVAGIAGLTQHEHLADGENFRAIVNILEQCATYASNPSSSTQQGNEQIQQALNALPEAAKSHLSKVIDIFLQKLNEYQEETKQNQIRTTVTPANNDEGKANTGQSNKAILARELGIDTSKTAPRLSGSRHSFQHHSNKPTQTTAQASKPKKFGMKGRNN